MKNSIKALESEKTIVLKYGGSVINIQKASQEKLFKKASKLIAEGDVDGLIKHFHKMKVEIEEFAGKDFEVKDDELMLKGSGEKMPTCIAKRLIEMKNAKADYEPLIKFWKKLSKNPSKASREELYGFMIHNNIPLTPDGDIVVEKGVKHAKSKGTLVDCHTSTIDNSIGMTVSMKRSDVDSNRNQTCSRGLHVAPPDYVRNFYSDTGNKAIVECIVNPEHVVSVPIDYNNQKMRVCEYYVTGYAPKSKSKPQIKGYRELLKNNSIPQEISLPVVQKDYSAGYKVISKMASLDDVLGKMTAREIIGYTLEQTGEAVLDKDDPKFNSKLKNKKGIYKKAKEILAKHREELEAIAKVAKEKADKVRAKKEKVAEAKLKKDLSEGNDVDDSPKAESEIDITGKKAKDIVAMVKKDFKKKIGGVIPRRASVIKQAIKLYANKGITLIDN